MKQRFAVFSFLFFLIMPLYLNRSAWGAVYFLNRTFLESLPVYITKKNIFSNAFKEPIERRYVIMKDGEVYSFTNNLENAIFASVGFMEEVFKADGYALSDAVLTIHNHFGYPRPSSADLGFLHELRVRGFTGYYLIYETSLRKVFVYVEK